MTERLFRRMADLLSSNEAVVLASVQETRGATPRKQGARMLVTAAHCEFSIGGGVAEARVIDAARALLHAKAAAEELEIALDGGRDAAGICGGRMRIGLRRWDAAQDRQRAAAIAATLAAGHEATLDPAETGTDRSERLRPDPRLLIIGAGHCGKALFDAARLLAYDIWVHDARAECFADDRYAGARCLCGDSALLRQALTTSRDVHAVLLSRDYRLDVDALQVLAEKPPAFIGMMGSRRRVHEVSLALEPAQRLALAHLQAPVGLGIAVEAPEEIAVDILAGLLRWRAQHSNG